MNDDALLVDALFRVMRELRRQFDIGAREIGLTLSRARVLSAIARLEGATQADLAQELALEPPTLKRQIDALEKDGFITRRGLDGDARKRALHLTDKGRSARVTRFVDSIRAEVLEGVAPEEQARMRAVLDRIIENTARLNDK